MLSHNLSVFAVFSLAWCQINPAPLITDNQYGIDYVVALNKGPGPLSGTFDFKAISKGVQVGFNINGFNVSDETTYIYHIHEKPVPQDGNCNATGEHFDPYHVGAARNCDPNQSDLCQLGDLSGKHGAIVVNASLPACSIGYNEDFLSTSVDNTAFFANLSVVVHRKRDNYRLNCGNFQMIAGPMFVNGSTQTAGNLSTTTRCDSSVHAQTSTSSAIPISTVSGISNMTSAVSAAGTATPSIPAHYSSSANPSNTTSSGMSLETGNYGSGRVEASLIMLGLAAVIPSIFL